MKYIEVKIFAGKQGIEHLITAVMMLGVSDFIIEDPAEIAYLLDRKNTYDWDYIDEKVLDIGKLEPGITVYLEDNSEGERTFNKIKSELGGLRIEHRVVDDETWNNSQKELFKPIKVTNRIIIKPSWEEYEAAPDEIVIELDPGMAFGTGMHPTTSMCMKMMEGYAGRFRSVLDIGCGSGILSITAAALGAEDILGIEIDGKAADVARENVALNGFVGRIRISGGDLTKGIDFRADLVVANLMAELVMLLTEDVRRNLTPGGIFISSGILIEKQEVVKASIKEAGFEILYIMEEDEWCAISARLGKNGK